MYLEELGYQSVGAFHRAIGSGVVRNRRCGFDIQELTQVSPECRCDAGVAVSPDNSWETVESEDGVEELVREVFTRGSFLGRY